VVLFASIHIIEMAYWFDWLRVYTLPDTEQVILETFFPAIFSWLSTEETKPNTKKQTTQA